MKLYFSPMACSLSSRIVIYETGEEAEFVLVDTKTKRLQDGSDYYSINPLGQVPVLEMDDGGRLFENTAILQYIGRNNSASSLVPPHDPALANLQRWLGFITSELHKGIFTNLFDSNIPDDIKEHIRNKGDLRFDLLNQHLKNRQFLLDGFSVADAYLFVVLNWAPYTGIELRKWPVLHAYHGSLMQRPSIARAMKEEWAMYQEEQKKRA